ncbi:HAMP domain-containing sensor histidine kinase [Mucilaginibacter sp. CSA2-8R]|uniref:sensor histidine kinase n=1 Tax=Mucilaginibacter sp. CSA2-8R TaxID=3141542 RepID=UPI00315DC43F
MTKAGFAAILKKWIGTIDEFPLNVRIFHAVCLISIVALAYNIPFNYYINLPLISLISAISLIVFATTYYLSRILKKTGIALIIFCVTGNLLFVGNFFLNSGVNGPTDIFFILTMTLMTAIVPVNQYTIWIPVNIIIVATLHWIQFNHPDLIPQTYINNKERYLDLTSAYLSVTGVTVVGYFIIRKNYDAERFIANHRAKMLNVLNDEKNKLFSIVAHDLRSPLSNIQNYLELLSDGDIDDEEALLINKSLLQSTRSTLDMLNNVLVWSKNQMDGLNVELKTLNVHQCLASQLSLFKNIAARKNISLDVFIPQHIQVKGSADLLQLVIRNLVNNAIKFTTEGGRVMVSARTEGANCLLMVKDSGMGQPIKLSDDIFLLTGSSQLGTANEKGVGLGLVLCKEYTAAQNGKIWFHCDSISGTTFFVQLPTASVQEKGAEIPLLANSI